MVVVDVAVGMPVVVDTHTPVIEVVYDMDIHSVVVVVHMAVGMLDDVRMGYDHLGTLDVFGMGLDGRVEVGSRRVLVGNLVEGSCIVGMEWERVEHRFGLVELEVGLVEY